MAVIGEMSKSVVLYGPNDLRLEFQQVPSIGEYDAKIQIRSVGLCGSDIVSINSGGLNNCLNHRPLRLGHEPAGVVQEVGAKVTNVKPGDRVAIEPLLMCKECRFCREGRANICENMSYLGDANEDGALTELHIQKASCCYKIPDSMTFEEGALVQPLSIAVGICKRAGISIGQTVLIGGIGVVGIMTMMVAKVCGASKICVTDVVEDKVEFAKKHGADCGVVVRRGESPTQISDRVVQELGGMADVSIDCCGISSSIETLVNATIPGGVLTLVGLSSRGDSISTSNIVWKYLEVKGFINTYNCYPKAIDLIQSGKVDVSFLITHRYSIDQYQKAFDNLSAGMGFKTVINL